MSHSVATSGLLQWGKCRFFWRSTDFGSSASCLSCYMFFKAIFSYIDILVTDSQLADRSEREKIFVFFSKAWEREREKDVEMPWLHKAEKTLHIALPGITERKKKNNNTASHQRTFFNERKVLKLHRDSCQVFVGRESRPESAADFVNPRKNAAHAFRSVLSGVCDPGTRAQPGNIPAMRTRNHLIVSSKWVVAVGKFSAVLKVVAVAVVVGSWW